MRFPFLTKRITPLLPITILLTLILLPILIFIPPTYAIPLVFFSLPILYIVFLLIFLVCFGIGTLLFKTRMHGLLLSLYILSVIILRMQDLKHPIFFLILTALFITSEFFFAQSHKKTKKEELKKIEITETENA